ncbi:hypothetical protein MAR_025921 [Mya arenaria]|uniref:Uncharacterized protein n=1 Tax=Mya arenaria TaxID=6604 RepID=A0ABY7EP22_MYAAR|nr:hypothetical protein MAR_025913 [Mya arenaria]WAR11741.1 hypothetical protein MAR_025921 [Mya arenaria]
MFHYESCHTDYVQGNSDRHITRNTVPSGNQDNDRIHRVILKHRGGGDIPEEDRTGDSSVRLPNNMPLNKQADESISVPNVNN